MDRYEAKRRYVENLMARNRNSELTDEQCNVLEKVCSFRHELHSNPDSLFFSESANYRDFNDMIECDMHDMLECVGLKNSLQYDTSLVPNDYCCDTDEDYENYLREVYEFVSKVNNDIESFLRGIDDKYNTHYAPTGATRLF